MYDEEILLQLHRKIALLREGSLDFSRIAFDTSYTVTGTESIASIYWNEAENTLDLVLKNGVVLQVGQEMPVLCKNLTGATITNGTPVMFGGTVGASGRIKAIKALADGTYQPAYTIGVATEDIETGQDGFVTWFGKIRGIDTTGTPYGEVWADGDIIYVSAATAGHLTNVMPVAPNEIITIGTVIYADENVGSLFVRPTWRQSAAYAEIHAEDQSTPQEIAAGETATKLTVFAMNGASGNATPDKDNDKITITQTGAYLVNCSISGAPDAVTVIHYSVYMDGVEVPNLHCSRKYATANDLGNTGLTGIVNITSVPSDLDLRARHTSGVAVNLTLQDCNLNVSKIN